MQQVSLTARKRTAMGTRAARGVRRTGKVPAVLYGREVDATSIVVDARELLAALATESGLNAIIDLSVDGTNHLTVPRELQRHPVRGDIIHLDFVKISLTERIEADVVIEHKGVPIGVREDGGILETVRNTVAIEALPADIPAAIHVDLTGMRIGDSFSISDLDPIEGVEILDPPDTTLFTLVAPRVEEEVAVPTLEGEEEIPLEPGAEPEGEAEAEEQD